MSDMTVKVPNGCRKWADCFTCPFRDCVATARPGRQKSAKARVHDAIYTDEKRQKRKEAGLCVNCGKEPAAAGHLCCERCLDIGRKKQAARRAAKKVSVPSGSTAE